MTALTFFAFAAFAESGVANAATTKCAIPNPCALFENVASGAAVEADANAGPGIRGTTDSGNYLDPGIEGESQNPDGSDAAGAFGLNVYAGGAAPAYGVLAYGSADGAYGETESAGRSSGEGVEGIDNGGAVDNDLNGGVLGYSSYGTGVIGEAYGSPSTADFGTERVGGYFVGNDTGKGGAVGVYAESNDAAAVLLNSGTREVVQAAFGQLLFGYVEGNGGAKAKFGFDDSGNESLAGSLTTNAVLVRTQGRSGRAKVEYGARTATPQLEDTGESQLVDGRAYVPIDAELADVIDGRTAYLVFLTPQGDCNGLYVTQKGSAGFAVRELHGGRSSLAFDYRIVAKPLGEDGLRLAVAGEEPGVKRPVRFENRTALRPETPLARLKRILGPAETARALRTFEAEKVTR